MRVVQFGVLLAVPLFIVPAYIPCRAQNPPADRLCLCHRNTSSIVRLPHTQQGYPESVSDQEHRPRSEQIQLYLRTTGLTKSHEPDIMSEIGP